MNSRLGLFLALAETEDYEEGPILHRHLIEDDGRRRRVRRFSRAALQHPIMSAFTTLFGCGCDQSLITLCGLDHRAFRTLLRSFEPIYNRYSPYSSSGRIRRLRAERFGRPRSMTALQCLALYLTWTRTQGMINWVCIIFGVTGSVASLFLRFARRIIVQTMRSIRCAAIVMPSDVEIARFKQAITNRHPRLQNVYCVADGVKLRLQQSGNAVIQNAFYNGWTHDHYVGNVLVFAPSGRIIACALNAPGCLHDSTIASYGDIYRKLREAYGRTGGLCVVDSAFAVARHPFLIKSSNTPNPENLGGMDYEMSVQATAARQSAEWGMRAVQSSFPRLLDRIVYEERGERRLVLLSIVYLFNFRTSTVGLNQLLSVYMPWLDRDAEALFHV